MKKKHMIGLRKLKLRLEQLARATVILAALIAAPLTTRAQEALETKPYVVEVSAIASGSQIILSWPAAPEATGYTINRKAKDDTLWGFRGSAGGTATGYTDSAATGETWEYEVIKTTGLGFSGYGYCYAGIQAPLVEDRGKVILVVDNTYAISLSEGLSRLEQNLRGDGWTVIRMNVGRGDTVPNTPDHNPTEASNIRNSIIAEYAGGAGNVKAVFLFGRVPILRSGWYAPDGHTEELRSFAADMFYGDMDGVWSGTEQIPTAGPDEIPSDIELMVGRVDFAEMHGFVSGGTDPTEIELLRRYLVKDHRFRNRQYVFSNIQRRGLIASVWGAAENEAYAANGFRNFAPLVGAIATNYANQTQTTPRWITTLDSGTYLWAYGAGGGDHHKAAQLGTTLFGGEYQLQSQELYSKDPWVVFTMLFGSWFVEWDRESQWITQPNLMRTMIALPQYGLTCAWVGRPHYYYHHMALGEPIGHGMRLTQNNDNTLYKHAVGVGNRLVHVTLLGDPTLRMHPVIPPSNLTGTTNGSGVTLTWTASTDTGIQGYHVYRANTGSGPFGRLNSSLITGTTYLDSGATSGTYTYMVRAVKLETVSGSYFNPSQGIFVTVGNGPTTWAVTGSTTPLRAYHTETKLQNGKVLIVGGANEANPYLANARLYDPATGVWSTTGNLTTGRRAHSATLLGNGKVLVVGGVGTAGYLATAELYNPATGTWAAAGSINARASHTATLLSNGKVLIAGGSGPNGTYPANTRLYDPVAGTWATSGTMANGREGHTATLLSNNKVLVVGGWNPNLGGELASAELYTPGTGTWAGTTALPAGRDGHSATRLNDGKVLVAGGGNFANGQIAGALIYDPLTPGWTAAGNLNIPRSVHTDVKLSDGRVMITGGSVGNNCFLSDTEFYNPGANSWTVGTPMTSARMYHTTSLLSGDKVLAVGGFNSFDSYMGSAEVYYP